MPINSQLTLYVGETERVFAEEVADPGNVHSAATATWAIDDPTVATIDSAGPAHAVHLTAVAAGQAVLTATAADGTAGSARVIVNDPAASKKLYIGEGDG